MKKIMLEIYARLLGKEIHRSFCHNAKIFGKGFNKGLFCSKCKKEIFDTWIYGVKL